MPRKKKEEAETKAAAKPKAPAKPKAATKLKAQSSKILKPAASKAPKAAKETKAPPAPKAVKIPKVKIEKAPAAKKSTAPRIPTSPLKKLQRKGETQMVAFIRDPQCLFTYWEVTSESIESVKQQLQDEFRHSSMVLRVFRKDSGGKVELIQEIFVEAAEMNRYITLSDPRGSYFLEIGLKAPSGQVFVYARSNDLVAGPDGFTGSTWSAPSKDPQWETPAGLLEYFSQEEYTETFLTPGGVSSADSLRRKTGRHFSSNIRS